MIKTQRFILRPLRVSDVSEQYLSWLSDAVVMRFIKAAGDSSREVVCEYVAERQGRDDVLFLGIFTMNGEHIGNIKYEPIDRKRGYAVMGILVGEIPWRGKGVASEVIQASARWLHRNFHVRTIALGVDPKNLQAIGAYRRLGFVEENTDLIPASHADISTMVWRLNNN